MTAVTIKAFGVEDLGGGEFRLMFEGRELPEEFHRMVREMFPNLADRVYETVSMEVMLGSIVTSK